MTGKFAVTVYCLVITLILTVFCVELFVPITYKIDFNDECRITIMKVESNGGISTDLENDLKTRLTNRGFSNIQITCGSDIKKGSDINLHVSAEYSSNPLITLFSRAINTDTYIYDRTTVSRKVVN